MEELSFDRQRVNIFGILIYIQEKVGVSLCYGIPTVGLIIFPLILNFEG